MKKPKTTAKPGWLKATLMDWLGIPIGLDSLDETAWRAIAGGSVSGVQVTNDTMLTLSAVWACAGLIADCISTMPLPLYERTTDGRRPAPQHPLYGIIHDQPNVDTSAMLFWQCMVAAMLLRGNGRAEKLMIAGRLVGLKFLSPSRLFCSRTLGGIRTWRYTERDGRQREIPDANIWTVPGFSLDGFEGVSVISYGARVFGNALAADSAASATFDGGLLPTTVFKYPLVLNPTQRADARDAITTLSGAMNAGKPIILEAGMDAMNVGIDPVDAQLLESRAFSVEEVCRWFRVPPFMVGHSEKSTSWGTGIEQQMIGFATFTLMPWLRRIEQAISKDLLTPVDRLRYYAKFSIDALLRADSAGRAAFYGVMVDKGIFTTDECRVLEDREPMGGNAAKLRVQSAMVLLDSLGADATPADAAAARASIRSWLGLDESPQGGAEVTK